MLGLNIVVARWYRRLCACDTCARLQGTRRAHYDLLSSVRPSLPPTLTLAPSLRLIAQLVPAARSQLPFDCRFKWQNLRAHTQTVILEDELNSAISSPLFGPPIAHTERTHPLGKKVRIRIDRERGLLRPYRRHS